MLIRPPINDEDRVNRLRLIRSENVGPITFRQLMARYDSAERALDALPGLAGRAGRRRRLRIPDLTEIKSEMEALQAFGGRMLHLGDPDYPPLLAETEDAPPVLNAVGDQSLLHRPTLAIVGSRNASTNGKRMAAQFASEVGRAGFCIASGLAMGIDTAAHSGALATGTVAVLAGGINVIYPRENTNLYRAIAEGGTIVAEMPFGTVGQARHFPRRNRIISGLSRAVLIVEATLRSGSLITARLAADQGRDVFAIPGSPLDPRARGGNDLIRKGAALIETPDELLGALDTQLSAPQAALQFEPVEMAPRDGDDTLRDRLLTAMGPTAIALDDLVADLSADAGEVSSIILELELAGTVERRSGGKIARIR
ncbi:DNA-processing protein DprA [Pacificispira sp.]|uniref:DNA-processing protein DprA n=1 Tax=Pacificispira sp. TaxID=2888761 RepID=UPI003B522895